jgi:hypothetical protein
MFGGMYHSFIVHPFGLSKELGEFYNLGGPREMLLPMPNRLFDLLISLYTLIHDGAHRFS